MSICIAVQHFYDKIIIHEAWYERSGSCLSCEVLHKSGRPRKVTNQSTRFRKRVTYENNNPCTMRSVLRISIAENWTWLMWLKRLASQHISYWSESRQIESTIAALGQRPGELIIILFPLIWLRHPLHLTSIWYKYIQQTACHAGQQPTTIGFGTGM